MRQSLLSAQEIAEHQLLAALRLWHESDYLSALTLAGAAEEILGKLLRKLGKASALEQIRNEIVVLVKSHSETDSKTEKIVTDLLNQSRNELKHYDGNAAISFDLRADASEMLERAIFNYQLLTNVVMEEAIFFWKDVRDT